MERSPFKSFLKCCQSLVLTLHRVVKSNVEYLLNFAKRKINLIYKRQDYDSYRSTAYINVDSTFDLIFSLEEIIVHIMIKLSYL